LVTSDTDTKIKYSVEKVDMICSNCALSCDKCNICVHTFKCSCINNVIYLNICKHIHAIAKLNSSNQSLNSQKISIPTIHQDILLKNAVDINNPAPSLDDEIKQKMEIMFGMYN